MDEATSTLDDQTEGQVMKEVTERFQGKTIIAIAYPLRSVAGFDRMVELRDGRIVE